MSEFHGIANLLSEMASQVCEFGRNVTDLHTCQRSIENANVSLERFFLSLSSSKSVLSFNENSTISEHTMNQKIESTYNPTGSVEKTILNGNSSSQTSGNEDQSVLNSSISKSSKSGSLKRQRESPFSLERQRTSIPKKLQNTKDIASLERILTFIAGKKKDGALLKEIVVLVNESTIRCNEYLNALIKLEEIVRGQSKKGLVYSLHPNRYYKHLNS